MILLLTKLISSWNKEIICDVFRRIPVIRNNFFSFLYKGMHLRSNSILKLMMREMMNDSILKLIIPTQILCFLRRFHSLKVPSNPNLSQIKPQMQTKIRSQFQNNFNRLLDMPIILGEKSS